MGVCCWHQLPSVLSRPAARQHTRELMSTRTHPSMINPDYNMILANLTLNYQYFAYKSKFESRAIPVRVAMLPRNFEDKYHSHPHPLLMKCEARAISRDPVLMRAIELRLYARLVSSAWWRRRLDHAVLFKSFISVTHRPSQRNWWIVQIYGIPMPEQVGIFFRGFARLMKVSHCSSGSSLVIAMTWPQARHLQRYHRHHPHSIEYNTRRETKMSDNWQLHIQTKINDDIRIPFQDWEQLYKLKIFFNWL